MKLRCRESRYSDAAIHFPSLCATFTKHDIHFLVCAGENHEPLSWDLRVYIALDVARGIEYLHDGVNFHII